MGKKVSQETRDGLKVISDGSVCRYVYQPLHVKAYIVRLKRLKYSVVGVGVGGSTACTKHSPL